MKESRTLEYKENISNSFLKTVSAYSNYGGGKIIFGIKDDGTIKGIENPRQACLDIENKINDSIDPVPEYSLQINEKKSTVILEVHEGIYKPYLYRGKAYKRNDTATIETDRLELSRLILEGQNISFEELPASGKRLAFSCLEKSLKKTLRIKDLSLDTLKTLELYHNGKGFNKAAELLSDKNKFCGIDCVRFGENINIILDRENFSGQSVIMQYENAVAMYRKYYQYEQIKGIKREKISLIPEEAFREAAANALVHRSWDINACISIAMHPDKIEIVSPGGLPKGISIKEYIGGGISILRNRILGGIFFRLRLIEHFGTGIRRINESYSKSSTKPMFDITENSVKITLPAMQGSSALGEDENKIYAAAKGIALSSAEIGKTAGFGKTKTISILKKLIQQGYIKSTGSGRGTKYIAE